MVGICKLSHLESIDCHLCRRHWFFFLNHFLVLFMKFLKSELLMNLQSFQVCACIVLDDVVFVETLRFETSFPFYSMYVAVRTDDDARTIHFSSPSRRGVSIR